MVSQIKTAHKKSVELLAAIEWVGRPASTTLEKWGEEIKMMVPQDL
jgi:hypothetical protein